MMDIQLATPEQMVFEGKTNYLLLNTIKGQTNILNRHTNLITFVEKGPVVVRSEGGEEHQFTVREGVLKVQGRKITLLSPEITSEKQ